MIKRLKPYFPSDCYNKMLILCSYKDLSEKQKNQLVTILKDNVIDWEGFILFLIKNNARALVLNNLLKHCSKELAPKNLTIIRSCIQKTLVRNLRKVSQLKKIVSLFNNNNIPSIPWKGPILSKTIFGQPTTRAFGDLDIIIQKENLFKAKDLLIEAGYIPFWKMTKEQELAYTKHRHSYEFLKEDGVDVELHWKLTKDQYCFPISMDDFWKTSYKHQFLGETIQLPSKENLILGLSLHHGGVECWLKYKLILDWFYLLETYHDVNWEVILNRANQLGIRRIILVGTIICEAVFGYEIPTILAETIQRKDVELAQKIIENIFSKEQIVKQSLILLELRERPLDKARVAYKIMATPSLIDKYASTLPKWLTIFERPIRLINRFILKKEDEFLSQYSNR